MHLPAGPDASQPRWLRLNWWQQLFGGEGQALDRHALQVNCRKSSGFGLFGLCDHVLLTQSKATMHDLQMPQRSLTSTSIALALANKRLTAPRLSKHELAAG